MLKNKFIYLYSFFVICNPLYPAHKVQLKTPASAQSPTKSIQSISFTNPWVIGLGVTGSITAGYLLWQARAFFKRILSTPWQEPLADQPKQPLKPIFPHAEEEEKKKLAHVQALIEAIKKQYQQDLSANSVYMAYQEGKTVFLRVMEPSHAQLSANDIRHLLWFFYIEAVATKTNYNFFEEGTFRFRGTKVQINKLYDALLNAAVPSYTRMSSHYGEHAIAPTPPEHWWNFFASQEYWVDLYNYLFNRHKGLDLDGLPPRDMHTILFEKLQDDQLYIKPEQHGTNSTPDFIQHTKDFIISQAKKKLPENILEFLGDVMTLRPDDANEFQKERVPTEIQKKAPHLIERAEKILSEHSAEHVKTQTSEVMKWGIQRIVPKLAEYVTNVQLKEENPQLHADIQEYLNDLTKRYQDWRYRKGHEIVFTIDELVKAAQ